MQWPSLRDYGSRVGDNARISRGYDEANDKKKGFIRENVSAPGDWSEVVLQGPHFFVATPLAKQPPHMGSYDDPQDLTTLPANSVPATKYRRDCDLDQYRQAQDQWLDYSLPEPVARPSTRVLPSRLASADCGQR